MIPNKMIQEITPEELKTKLDSKSDIILIDVREVFEKEHADLGGMHIPMGLIPLRINELDPYKNRELVIYCRSSGRSTQAT